MAEKVVCKRVTFKGKPLLTIEPEGENVPLWAKFSFGVTKGEKIVDNLIEVLKFVRDVTADLDRHALIEVYLKRLEPATKE